MVTLPLIAFIGCWAALYVGNRDWRTSFIEAAILWAVWLALTTETLSSVFWISQLGLAAAWLLAAALAWLVAIRSMKMQSAAFGDNPGRTVAVKLSGI